MNFTIKKLGGEFNVEGKDLKEIIKQASLIQQLPENCSLCSGEVRFDFRSPKGYDYYSIRCMKCGATRNFGISKEDNNLFLRWDEGFAKYVSPDAPKTQEPHEPGYDNKEPDSPF